MNRLIANPNRRIALAVIFAFLLHGIVMWFPKVQLPEHKKVLPPLVAKLIPLPKTSGTISAHSHKQSPKQQPLPQPEPAEQQPPESPLAESSPVATSEPVAASAPLASSESVATSAPIAASEPVAASQPTPSSNVVASSASIAASTPVAASEVSVADAVVSTPVLENGPQRPPLPKHAKLQFDVYIGKGSFKAGESVHTLDIDDGHYILKADAHTTGLVNVFKTYHIEQTSTGVATKQTLKPETFTEVISQSDRQDTKRADFDWSNKKIRFSNGAEAALPPQALDILSTLYQFPPMREQDEIISLSITTGDKIETFRFQVDFEEALQTAMGTLQTVHFRRLHNANEEGLEIWFAQEYRLLPVKVRHLDRNGKADGEAVITDIRVSDE